MEFIATLVAALLGSGIVTGFFQWIAKRREHDIRMVEIGLAILREDPNKDEISPARDWAIELIERYSRVKFSTKSKEELLRYKVSYPPITDDSLNILRDNIIYERVKKVTEEALMDNKNIFKGGIFGSSPEEKKASEKQD